MRPPTEREATGAGFTGPRAWRTAAAPTELTRRRSIGRRRVVNHGGGVCAHSILAGQKKQEQSPPSGGWNRPASFITTHDTAAAAAATHRGGACTMTRPRAMLAGDDPSADPLLSCLAAIRAPPRELETAPRTADGSRLLCKRFCRADGGSCERPDCPDAHVPIAQRQTCWTFDRYGVCAREEARRADPKAPRCWFPHLVPPPAAHHIALQVEVGMSDRVVSRCRELLGPDAVVGAARADLSRNGDALVLVTAGGRGVASAARILAADSHLAARIKRAYATGDERNRYIEGERNERGGHSAEGGGVLFADASVVGDDADALDDALREKLASLVDAALGGENKNEKDSSSFGRGDSSSGPARVRVRCFPPRLRDVVVEALRTRDEDAGEATGGGATRGPRNWETRSRVDDATHALDVVAVRGRATVCAWSLIDDGPDSLRASLMDAGEVARKAMTDAGAVCRAFHKIEEATARAGTSIEPTWRCVDVGAAPGGWTQWLSARLDVARGGVVFAVDPAELGDFVVDGLPLPPNVTHLKMRGEDAVKTVLDGYPGDPCPVDFLACDANVSPTEATGIVSSFVPALRRGATLVLTFKDAAKGYAEWRRQMESATETLTAAGFETPRIFHLFSNRSREKTVVAKFAGRESGRERARGTAGCPAREAPRAEASLRMASRNADGARLLLARSLAVFATMPGEFAEAHIKARGFAPPPNGSVRLMRGRLLKILSDEVIAESSWHAS